MPIPPKEIDTPAAKALQWTVPADPLLNTGSKGNAAAFSAIFEGAVRAMTPEMAQTAEGRALLARRAAYVRAKAAAGPTKRVSLEMGEWLMLC